MTVQQKGRAHRTTTIRDIADTIRGTADSHAKVTSVKITTKPPDNFLPPAIVGGQSSGIYPPFGFSGRKAKFDQFMDAGKTEAIVYERNCTGFVIQLIKKRTWSSDEGKYEGVRYWRYIEDGSSNLDHTFGSFKDLKEFEESMRSYYIHKHDKEFPGIVKVKTGLASMDNELAEMPLGSLVLITGKSGAGKTLLADQIYRTQSTLSNQWKTGVAVPAQRFNGNRYNDLGAAVDDINAYHHLVVFDDLRMTDPFDATLLRGKVKKWIDWAILTLPGSSLSDSSPSRVADYVFNIEKSHDGWFKIKCLKNRWGLNKYPHGIKVKIKTTTHLEVV